MHCYFIQYLTFSHQLNSDGFPLLDEPQLSALQADVVQLAYPLEYASDIRRLEDEFQANFVQAKVISFQSMLGMQRPQVS